MMHMTLYLAVLRVSGAAFNPGFLPGSYEALLYLCLPDGSHGNCIFGTLGTTPGKAMLGVSVRDYRGRRLSFPPWHSGAPCSSWCFIGMQRRGFSEEVNP